VPTERARARPVTVLGAGVAGLAVGHYARQRGLPATILEAQPHWGGSCRTLRWGEFRFDLGAHRFHDKDATVTGDLMALMGERMARVSVPSHIWHRGRLIDFPPTLANLVATLGPAVVLRSATEMLGARLSPRGRGPDTFEKMTLRSYGRTLAELFLLSYSRKLWGVPCSQLSPRVGGGRLRGLNLRSVLASLLSGRSRPPAHMEGSFYYPRHGIGEICDALARSCPEENIRSGVRVTRVRHRGQRVVALETDAGERIEVDRLVSTIPLGRLVSLLDPPAPDELARDARQLRFRHLRLVVLLVARPSVTTSGTVYFPDPRVPFTRVFEPRNRSEHMAPPGQTSLVAEIPCFETDQAWREPEALVVERTVEALVSRGWLERREVTDARALQVSHAYPLLDLAGEAVANRLRAYLSRFENLTLDGRSGRFEYAWIHDLVRRGREVVDRLA
jgi:protoporphyrinogen oxidase